MILDEPTAGVDVELRRDLWRYLQELNAEGKTILLTSHYLEEVERLCRNIAIVAKGRIVQNGPKHEFFTEPGGLETAYLRATGATPEHIAAGRDRYYRTPIYVQEIQHRRATAKRNIPGV